MNRYFPFVCLLLLTACNFTGKLTRRYKTITYPPSANIDEWIQVSGYVLEPGKATVPSKSIFDLSSSGQSALINTLAKNDMEPDSLMTTLGRAVFKPKASTSDLKDYTRIHKRIVISVKNRGHQQADRISKLEVLVGFSDKIQIVSCNRLATEYQTLDMGKLSYQNTNFLEATGNLSLSQEREASRSQSQTDKSGTGESDRSETAGWEDGKKHGMSQGLAGKLSASRSFDEEVALRQRLVTLSASLQPHALALYQEGVSGIDLTGNIIADVVLDGSSNAVVEKIYSFEGLGSDENTAAEKIMVHDHLVSYMNLSDDVLCSLSFQGDYRHVVRGDRTISESDDEVEMRYGDGSGERFTLFRREELRPLMWSLNVKGDNLPVEIKSELDEDYGILIFDSYRAAKNFRAWLSKHAVKKRDEVGAIEIAIGGTYMLRIPSSATQTDVSDKIVISSY